MTRIVLYLMVFFCSSSAYAQKNQPDVVVTDELDSMALYSIFTLLGVEFSQFTISAKFKGHYCNFKIYEYKNGQLTDSIAIREKGSFYDYALLVDNGLVQDKFRIGFYSQKTSDTSLKAYIRIGKLGVTKSLKLSPARAYSLKEVLKIDPALKIKSNEFLPLFSYTNPIDKKYSSQPNASEFCRINGESIPFQNWYKELGIGHYYIFGIVLEQ